MTPTQLATTPPIRRSRPVSVGWRVLRPVPPPQRDREPAHHEHVNRRTHAEDQPPQPADIRRLLPGGIERGLDAGRGDGRKQDCRDGRASTDDGTDAEASRHCGDIAECGTPPSLGGNRSVEDSGGFAIMWSLRPGETSLANWPLIERT